MKIVWTISTLICLLAFSTSTGTYLPQQVEIKKDTTFSDSMSVDTAALLSIIQPVADSFAVEAVKKIDSIVSVPKFFIKRVDVEHRVDAAPRAWITIYRKQNGQSKYDTTIIVEIPNQ